LLAELARHIGLLGAAPGLVPAPAGDADNHDSEKREGRRQPRVPARLVRPSMHASGSPGRYGIAVQIPTEIRGKRARRLIPIVGIFLDALRDDRVEIRGQRWQHRTRRSDLAIDHVDEQLESAAVLERRHPAYK